MERASQAGEPAAEDISTLLRAWSDGDQSGAGAGVITVVKPDGTQFPNTPSEPAKSGDALVIYCAGLGAVNPLVPDGAAAPSSPPAMTVNPVNVTIGGKPAPVLFSGLAPGFAGLYQVNETWRKAGKKYWRQVSRDSIKSM